MMTKSVVALVDADYLVYACGFAAEHCYYMLGAENGAYTIEPIYTDKREALAELANYSGPDDDTVLWSRREVEPVENALHSVKMSLHRIFKRVEEKFDQTIKLEIYLTGGHNFRDRIATIRPYKGNRKPWHKPRLGPQIVEYLCETWDAKLVWGQEADDEVAIRQTEIMAEGGKSVICGIDKDLLQVPGYHYNPHKDKFAKIGEGHGLRLFYRQVLTGDSTDNIGGCYKVGPARAKKIVTPEDWRHMCEANIWAEVVEAYAESILKYGPTKCGYESAHDAAVENGVLCWMRRERDQIWEPPS